MLSVLIVALVVLVGLDLFNQEIQGLWMRNGIIGDESGGRGDCGW